MSTDVSEERIASFFRGEEEASQDIRNKRMESSVRSLVMSCLAYSSIFKIEAIGFSETSVDVYRIT
jgi:hypothetical protein